MFDRHAGSEWSHHCRGLTGMVPWVQGVMAEPSDGQLAVESQLGGDAHATTTVCSGPDLPASSESGGVSFPVAYDFNRRATDLRVPQSLSRPRHSDTRYSRGGKRCPAGNGPAKVRTACRCSESREGFWGMAEIFREFQLPVRLGLRPSLLTESSR